MNQQYQGQPYQGQPYQPSNYSSFDNDNERPLTLKDWLITFLLLMIPFANIILPFYWAFASDVNINKKNYFRAYLIVTAIVTVLVFLLSSVWIALLASMMTSVM